MTARAVWQPRDLSPDARRAAEAAAEAAGVPLKDWIADTVRAAIIRELGSIPAEEPAPEPSEPPAEAAEREPAPPAIPIASALPESPPAAEPAKPFPSVGDYRSRRILSDAERLAAGDLAGWLATRIESLPAGAPSAPPSEGKRAPPPTPPVPEAPPKPQLDLFSAPPAPAPTPPAPAPASPPPTPPPETIRPLALPAGPVVTLALTDLRPARVRSRRASDADPAIAALAASVSAQGVREPVLVRRLTEEAGHFEVVAGERRRLAAERVGRADLPAILVRADDAEALILSLAENLGRSDFSPLDEARAYLRLMTEYRVNPSVLARRLARERTQIALAMRLLGLPETVRRLVDGGQLAPAQAYALLSASDPEAMAQHMIEANAPAAARG